MLFVHKEWQDPEDGIETVVLYWTSTPLGAEPQWKRARQLVMVPLPATFPVRRRGAFWVTPPAPSRRALSTEPGRTPEGFVVHHFFEVVQRGRRWSSEAGRQEIRAKMITHSDPSAECTQATLYYSLDSFDHIYRVPMLLEGLPTKYQCLPPAPAGRSGGLDERAHTRRSTLVARLPPPHAFQAPIWGPADTRARYAVYFSREGALNPFSEGGFWLLHEGRFWEVQL
jgi:hypothetical protein